MNDGMILFYCKDNKAHPVAMSNEQHQMLQILMPVIFGNETIQVLDKPTGDVYNMSNKE